MHDAGNKKSNVDRHVAEHTGKLHVVDVGAGRRQGGTLDMDAKRTSTGQTASVKPRQATSPLT